VYLIPDTSSDSLVATKAEPEWSPAH
jgi:hypothetical protein